jgi:hypothetical protein
MLPIVVRELYCGTLLETRKGAMRWISAFQRKAQSPSENAHHLNRSLQGLSSERMM